MRYSEPLDDIGRLIMLTARARRSSAEEHEIERLFCSLGEPACRASAKQNKVEALVGSTLFEVLGEKLSTSWRDMLEDNRRRVEELLAELRSVAEHLRSENIPSALIESGGILLSSDLPLRAYGSGDFDILVEESSWERTLSILKTEGWSAADRRGHPTTRIEHSKKLESGRVHWLEVGFRPFDRMYMPLAHTDRSKRWLKRRIPARKNQTMVEVLDPTDGLAHIAMHTSLHSYVRSPGVRLHVDADRLIRDNQIQWPRFLDEIIAMNVPTRAFVTLSMAAGLLATPVPDNVLERLFPGTLRWLGLQRLLMKESVIADGVPKLVGSRALLLDMMLEERSVPDWLASAVLPSPAWMREHFDREGRGDATWRLHARRFWQLSARFRPR